MWTVSHSASLLKPVRFSVRLWAWFNWNAKADPPLDYGIRQITDMTEKEFIEMAEEELFPAVSYRFGKRPVTVLEDFDSFAIPPEVYEWFSDLKLDQFPPKSRNLSPFLGIWRSIANTLNREALRFNNRTPDQLWVNIELSWSSKSRFLTDSWSREIEDLKTKIHLIVEETV